MDQEPLKAVIRLALDHYAHCDAIFLAERLHAELNNEESVYLLATCHYRAGKTNAAYSILRKVKRKTTQCRLLLARCCYELSRYKEAEIAILPSLCPSHLVAQAKSQPMLSVLESTATPGIKNSKQTIPERDLLEFGDSAPFAAQLLGMICSKTKRPNLAAEYLAYSLRLNPFLWRSFECLTQLASVHTTPDSIFTLKDNTNLMETITTRYTTPSFTTSDPLCSWTGINSNPLMATTTTTAHSATPVVVANNNNNSRNSNNNNNGTELSTPANQLSLPYDTSSVNHSTASNLHETQHTMTPGIVTPQLGQTTTGVNTAVSLRRSSRFLSTVKENANSNAHKTPAIKAFACPNAPPRKIRRTSAAINNDVACRRRLLATPAATAAGVQQQNVKNDCKVLLSKIEPRPALATATTTPASTGTTGTKRQLVSTDSLSLSSATITTATTIATPATTTTTVASQLNKVDATNGQLVMGDQCDKMARVRSSLEAMLAIMSRLGRALDSLAHYKLDTAIALLESLPKRQLETGWVLCCLGRAYYEKTDYSESVRYYEKAHQREPYRLSGMEYYSSSLWHLNQDVKLSMLAQELIEFDKLAPETWCVAGNSFSLQKEHETAIKYLERALQLDPTFAYAYTLLGHELMQADDRMDQAMTCFRSAIHLDRRNYNAWYGLGSIYYKKEKWHLAEMHHRMALNISPTNPVLMCHVAVVQHACKRSDLAIETLSQALKHDPMNVLCKFHRATIYFATDKNDKALEDLAQLRHLVPKESMVYFLSGKVHKKMKNIHLALIDFSWAIELDPKGTHNNIKEIIDKQYAAEEEDGIVVHRDQS